MSSNKRIYTVMVIPESHEEKTISIQIAKKWITAFYVAVACVAVFLGFILYKTVDAARKMHLFYDLQNDNTILIKENSYLRAAYQKINRLDSIADYLTVLSTGPQQNDPPKVRLAGLSVEKTTIPAADASPADSVAQKNRKDSVPDIDLHDQSNPTVLPVAGWVTQQFLKDPGKGREEHLGIDIAAAEGVSIKAPASGTVIDVSKNKDYGKMIVIKHNSIFTTRYGHCAMVLVEKNGKVERGQTIALVGNTGYSTAPHLHYEVIKNGKHINPMDLISLPGKN